MAFTPYRSLSSETVDRTRTFVAVVDDTPECRLAMRFAAARAAHTIGGTVVLVHVISPVGFVQWSGVQDMLEQEAREEAEALLDRLAAELEAYAGQRPHCAVLTGETASAVMDFLRADSTVVALVLGANASGAPGPLVDFFSGAVAGGLPCAIDIVPGGLSEAQLDAIA